MSEGLGNTGYPSEQFVRLLNPLKENRTSPYALQRMAARVATMLEIKLEDLARAGENIDRKVSFGTKTGDLWNDPVLSTKEEMRQAYAILRGDAQEMCAYCDMLVSDAVRAAKEKAKEPKTAAIKWTERNTGPTQIS